MNNKLVVKKVDFNGAQLMAVQEQESKKVYVGVRWICDGIGLTDGQTKNERLKIQEDLVLKQGGRNLVLPTKGGNQEAMCIELEFLPLWLAKISITPKMQEEQPELTDRLLEYQLRAKDVLAQAFLPKAKPFMPPRLSETNAAAKIILQALTDAGMSPQFKVVALKRMYEPVGIEIPLDGITVAKHLYDTTAIAERFGLMSKTGNPHIQAVSAIISRIDVSDEERELVPFQNKYSGHSGTTYQYTESVLDKVDSWLKDNDYPARINHNGKSYGVCYKTTA